VFFHSKIILFTILILGTEYFTTSLGQDQAPEFISEDQPEEEPEFIPDQPEEVPEFIPNQEIIPEPPPPAYVPPEDQGNGDDRNNDGVNSGSGQGGGSDTTPPQEMQLPSTEALEACNLWCAYYAPGFWNDSYSMPVTTVITTQVITVLILSHSLVSIPYPLSSRAYDESFSTTLTIPL